MARVARSLAIMLAATSVCLVAGQSALAEPLPAERCEALAAELQLLEGGGAAENLTRGPEWARQNLAPEQLAYVKRLIEVREAVTFRCRTFAVVRDPPPPSVAPADAPSPQRKPDLPEATVRPAGEGMALPDRPRDALSGRQPGAIAAQRSNPNTAAPDAKAAGNAPSPPQPGRHPGRKAPAQAAPAKAAAKAGAGEQGASSGARDSAAAEGSAKPTTGADDAKPQAKPKQRRAKASDAYVPAPGNESTFPRPSLHEP